MKANDLAERVLRLASGQRFTIVGVGRSDIADAITADLAHSRGVLFLDTTGLRTGAAILDRLLDDLANLALSRWPCWHGYDEPVFGGAENALGLSISGPWLRAAARRAEAGRLPRFRLAARELELVQLLHAIDPAGVILVAEVDPASGHRAAPVIEALEWCTGHGAAVVAALPLAPPASPPYDRILYGACEVVHAPKPVAERFIPPRSRAHPASAIEQRVEAALQNDAELQGLFCCNETVPVAGWGQHPRVDLLCRAHRVVVELDGPEHRGQVAYGNDRHRDYRLLLAGYLVLRITNDQVETDLHRTIEKIRDVVRLRSLSTETR